MLSVRNAVHRLCAFASSQLRPPSPPRLLSTVSFPTLNPSQSYEEENYSWYSPKEFYPVRIGQIFQSRYQVIGKLGYGAYSTVWLCRDLAAHRYVTIKVCTQETLGSVQRELAAFHHLNSLPKSEHRGRDLVRTLLDRFEYTSEHAVTSQSSDEAPAQSYQCLVHKPLLMSFLTFRMKFPDRKLPQNFLKAAICQILLAVDYLHIEAKMIHTDISEKNILFGLNHDSVCQAFERQEQEEPVERKVTDDRVIYLSREMTPTHSDYGKPVLCDFGEARFGDTTYTDLVQPRQYRAPEVLLRKPWNEKVDIWSVGMMIWNMFEGRNMFETSGGPDSADIDVCHLAHMVSLLGPPPLDFLKGCQPDVVSQYFDAQGNWIGAANLPDDSLEKSEENLEGKDKALFLAFVRKMVAWKPEDRLSASELLQDAWFNAK